MDSAASGFLLNPSTFHSVYYQHKEDDGIIDLGLSLRTLEPEAYQPSVHPNQTSYKSVVSMEGYCDFTNLPQRSACLNLSSGYPRMVQQGCADEADGIQSREQWNYIKVNMDGIIVGRKVCILNHSGYPSLASQLEDMFGPQLVSGLGLFQAGSEFSLVYKDREENWRTVGDIPWREFVMCAKRLRIVRRT